MGTYNPKAEYVGTHTDVAGIGDRNYEITAREPVPSDWPEDVLQALLDGQMIREKVEVNDDGTVEVKVNPKLSYLAKRAEVIGIGDHNYELVPGEPVDDLPEDVIEVLIRNDHVTEVPKPEPEKKGTAKAKAEKEE